MAHKVQRWIDKAEAVFDSQSEVAPYSAGDTKTILTKGVNKPRSATVPLCVDLDLLMSNGVWNCSEICPF